MKRETLLLQINELKRKMGALWDERGETDPEILEISIEIDVLLNEYSRMIDA
ncbi:MAG: aspartyl-phosphate phosphatase Spo0E family protein [Firmicutes bacterium]|nr:aspartyl-phosphate phosphatase Spo0E family protein [Bacillota bacterium]